MQPRGPQITHLAYADDVIIFTSRTRSSIEMVLQQLRFYEECSSQLINANKSCFLVAPDTADNLIRALKLSTGYKHSDFPITYLGCPLCVGRKKIVLFNEVVSKIVRKTNSWQGKLLSLGGRAVLIKHVLQSQPLHLLVAINPPKTVIKQIEAYLAKFFWGSSDGKNRYH
ncbi:uncharacterized protein LOC132601926 [Lycium barbarum]|uniref:uncharacterized protein LOC132601926 n=1 Tax=Lycium barbarum TaxID=112863 RepID=UPI00293F2A9D|nr:uncharacterized protein LOC132601926 [Lycium barbarum]